MSGHDGRTAASWYGVKYEPIKLHEKFESDTILTIGNYKFQCIHSPGHTPGSISILVESEGFLPHTIRKIKIKARKDCMINLVFGTRVFDNR